MNENAFCGFRPKVLSLDSKTYSEERNAIQSTAFATGGGLVVSFVVVAPTKEETTRAERSNRALFGERTERCAL